MTNEGQPEDQMLAFLRELAALCKKHEATIDVELEGVSMPFRVLLSESGDGPEYAEFYVDHVSPRGVWYGTKTTHSLQAEEAAQ